MDYIKGFLDFVFDATKSLFSRLLLLLLFLFLAFVVDDYFQFSYNYRLNSQIQQIKEIESILKETTDLNIKKSLKKTEYKLLNSSNIVDYLSLSFGRNVTRISSINTKIVSAISPNPIFHYLFSNIFLITFMLWSIRSSFKETKLGTVFFSIIFVIGIFFVFIFWITAFISALVSLSIDNVYAKFILIVIVQPIMALFLYSIFAVKNIAVNILNDINKYLKK